LRRAFAAAAAIALVLLAGCGSSKLSTKQLRARASSVCKVAARKTARIPTPTNPAAGAAFLKRGIAALTPQVAALGRLKPPADVAAVYENSVHGLKQQLELAARTLRHLKAGDDPVAAMQALQRRLTPIESTVDGGWRALEIPACINL
jgi:phage FluMu protein gp41